MCALPVDSLFRAPPKYGRLQVVHSEVPCASLIFGWLCFRVQCLDDLVGASRRYERQYLAWETVRKTHNPFFLKGTGFEGYFVGMNLSPEEVAERLLQIGRDSLECNRRLYHTNHHFQSTLMKTLTGEMDDSHAIDVWSTELGAILGRLREHVYVNQEANQFQTATYTEVGNLPPISYEQHDHVVTQAYALPVFPASNFSRVEWSLNMLRPEDYDAGLVVWSIGRFGHPLVRECLHETGSWAP